MTKSSELAAIKAKPSLSAADVATYLKQNPDFFLSNPDLFALISAPSRSLGEGVIDLQSFILNRLRSDVTRLKNTQRKLIATSRNNLGSQTRVHDAVLALLGASCFEHFINVITDEFTFLLGIDAVGFCIEASLTSERGLGELSKNLHVLAPGSIEELLGPEKDVLLRNDIVGDPALFGSAAAGLVRSDALVLIEVSHKAPPGLLALGSRRPGSFNPGQGTELLVFLGHVIEHLIRAWLNLPE